MELVKLGAEILLGKLGEQGRDVSMSRAAAALSYVLPMEGGVVDCNLLMEKLSYAIEEEDFSAPMPLDVGVDQRITSSIVMAAFGFRAVSLYANNMGVGVAFAIECLAKTLPEFIGRSQCVDEDAPMLDLMTFKVPR